MPKIVAPLSACSAYVRVQGQRTGTTVVIHAGLNNQFDQVFSGQANGPDQTFKLTRKLKAGETVFVDNFIENAETVEPEPDQSELGFVTIDGHLHACGRCGAFANGFPGAEVVVKSTTRGVLGHAVVDPETGAAHVRFDPFLNDGEDLVAQQTLCGKRGPDSKCPKPDRPANIRDQLPAPVVKEPLRACQRALWIEGVAEGAIVRIFRDGRESSSACFPYSEARYRLRRELREAEVIKVDQRFPDCEYRSPFSKKITVDVAEKPNAPVLLGPFCKGTIRIGVDGLRYGARVTLVQMSHAVPGTRRQALQRGTVIADEEAWDTLCDIPLFDPLDRARGRFVFAFQTLCDLHSKASDNGEVHSLRGRLPAPRIVEPIVACGGMVRVAGIFPGAKIEIFMTCLEPPGIRKIASQHVYARTQDIAVAPALKGGQQVFVRQIACRQMADSRRVPVQLLRPTPPWIADCGSHLHVKGAAPGAYVEVYKDNSFFRSGRSGTGDLTIRLSAPLKHNTELKARQFLCDHEPVFGNVFTVRDDVEKRLLEVVAIGRPGHPNFSTERVCQLSGTQDPEGLPILNNCAEAGVKDTDLGIIVDHTTGDGRLYFFFGDTGVETQVVGFPHCGDCIARTEATEEGAQGPALDFLRASGPGALGDPGGMNPFLFLIPGVSQSCFEVPTGGFSHAGKLYVFASTDHYTEAPRTIGLGKDENFMGRSILVSSPDWDEPFSIVPGHDNISDRSREHWEDRTLNEFKFINIAPWKIRNADVPHLPPNAETSEEGLLMIGCGRYRESQPCLAYVPLPAGRDPDFSEWSFLAGYGEREEGTGRCGKPEWSRFQKDAIFLWDDSQFSGGNKGVVGELSMAFLPSCGLFVALYEGTKLRSAEFPWGPWSDPVKLFDFGRDHADHNNPSDPRPRYMEPGGGTYGPYIIPRFTTYDATLDETTIYHALSTWKPYQVMLLRTKVRPVCVYSENVRCGAPEEK
jgi:hypothetical protein